MIFGITGDLAKRDDVPLALPARGARAARLPDRRRRRSTTGRSTSCASAPATRSSRPASSSTRRSSTRFAARLSYLARRLRGRGDLRAPSPTRSKGAQRPVFYLEIPPFLFGTVVDGLRDAGLTKNARVVVEKPFGHDLRVGPRARRGAARVPRRDAALPHRPLPREDGARGDPLPALREHDARADLEPQLRRVRPDHDGRGLRRRGPRPLLRPGRRAARRRRQPPHAGRRRGRDGGAGRRATRRRSRTRCCAVFRAIADGRPGALRPRPVRRLPGDRRRRRRTRRPRPTRRCGWRSTTGAGRACRSSSAPASCMPVTQTELRLVFKRPPRLGFERHRARHPSRTSSSSSSTRRPACGCCSTRYRADADGAGADQPRHGVRRRGRRGRRRRTRCCCTPRCAATAPASRARTASRRRGGSCSRCSTRRRRSHPYAQGIVGPGGGRRPGRRPRPLARALDRVGGSTSELRRHHHRHRRGRRHARPPPRPVGQAHPAARARRLAAARARRTGRPHDVFVDNRYVSPDTWYDGDGKAVPAAGALLRRRRDEALRRRAVPPARGGLRRAAPPRRRLARVADRLRRAGAVLHARRAALRGARRARRGPDRAARRAPRTRIPAVAHEPRIQQLSDDLEAAGLPPVPRAVRRSCSTRRTCRYSRCVRCATCDGFPCLVHAKSDAEVLGVRPALEHAERHAADERARRCGSTRTRPARAVTEVVVDRDGARGALHRRRRRASPAARRTRAKLLLASANDTHPNGLANGSDQVGRNYMFHNSQAVLALSREENPTVFQKTLGLNDFYFGARRLRVPARQHPDGRQVAGADVPRREADRDEARAGAGRSSDVAKHAVDFWLSTEDLPRPENRVTLDRDGTVDARLHADQRRAEGAALHKLKSMLGHARHAPGPPGPPLRVPEERHPGRGLRAPGGHRALRHRPGDVGARHATAARTRSTTSTSSTRASSRASAR